MQAAAQSARFRVLTQACERQYRQRARSRIGAAECGLALEIPADGERREHRGNGHHALGAYRRPFELETRGRNVQHPGDDQRQRKPQQQHEDEDPQRPQRRLESRKRDARRLHRKPRHHQVGGAHLEYFAAFEFGDQRHVIPSSRLDRIRNYRHRAAGTAPASPPHANTPSNRTRSAGVWPGRHRASAPRPAR